MIINASVLAEQLAHYLAARKDEFCFIKYNSPDKEDIFIRVDEREIERQIRIYLNVND